MPTVSESLYTRFVACLSIHPSILVLEAFKNKLQSSMHVPVNTQFKCHHLGSLFVASFSSLIKLMYDVMYKSSVSIHCFYQWMYPFTQFCIKIQNYYHHPTKFPDTPCQSSPTFPPQSNRGSEFCFGLGFFALRWVLSGRINSQQRKPWSSLLISFPASAKVTLSILIHCSSGS